MQYPIHIAFCVSDNYVQYICVTIKSIIENHKDKDVTIHVLSDVLSDESIRRLNRTIGKDTTHIHLQIHYVDDTPLQGLKFGRWTKYAWYRILLPDILPDIDRVLYLDADMVICGSLTQLFELDIKDFSIGGVYDACMYDEGFYGTTYAKKECRDYICSGTLLMNLSYWRNYSITQKIILWAIENRDKLVCPDQDAINIVCKDSIFILPLKYGITEKHLCGSEIFYKKFPKEMIECVEQPIVIHYSINPSWSEACSHPFLNVWTRYKKQLKFQIEIIDRNTGKLNGCKTRIFRFFRDKNVENISRMKTFYQLTRV